MLSSNRGDIRKKTFFLANLSSCFGAGMIHTTYFPKSQPRFALEVSLCTWNGGTWAKAQHSWYVHQLQLASEALCCSLLSLYASRWGMGDCAELCSQQGSYSFLYFFSSFCFSGVVESVVTCGLEKFWTSLCYAYSAAVSACWLWRSSLIALCFYYTHLFGGKVEQLWNLEV